MKIEFTTWFKNIEIGQDEGWIFLGDFHLIRSPKNRNKPGGHLQEMFLFNSSISSLDLTEIPLQGKKYTWSNMQPSPLLESLDWVFTSTYWTATYPNTTVKTLEMKISDHCPFVTSISTISIPKAQIFIFENY